MKTSLSSITNLSISPRGRKLPVSIYEFVATVLSEYALSNLKVDSNDSAFHSISSYFVGGEILAKDLIQKLLIIPEIASIFDCFPSMGNGKEYDYAVWSQFLSDTTWEYDGKSSVFVFKEHTYAMENKVLILEKEPDGLFAKRLHCEATEQYYGRIGPGAREDKTAIQTPPIFTPRPQEVTLQDKDVEKAVSDADFFTLDESLQGADPQQREAITSGIDKNLIILAGAGSGKTRTLVARLAYLRAVKKIPLNRILLLTFTVAAAAEMRSRGKSLVDVIYSNIAPTKKSTVNARTIDSFVIQLVNTYYPQMGFSQKPVIYYSDNVETKQQKIQMLSEIIRENKLEGIFRFYLAGAGTQPEKLGRLLSDLIDYARGLPINCAGFDFLLQQYQEHQRASGKIMGFTEASLFVRDAIMQGRCTEVECEDSLKKVKALSDEVRLNQITSLADAVDRFSIKAGELYEGRVNEHHSDEVFEQFEEYCQNTSAPWPVPRAQLKEIFSTFEDNAKKRAVSGKPLTPGVRISTIHSAKGLEYDIVIITGLSAGQYPNTEQIDRKYAERNEQLKTFQESRACYYRQKQELDQSVFPTLLEECDSPIFTEAERDRMQDFQQELFDMRDGLLTLSADGVEEYLDAYVYFMTPLIAQYSSDIAKLNTELLNKQSEAEEMKEQILVATSDTAEDESNYNSQLEELCKSIADIGESIERLKIKRNRFFEATANLNNFYVQCLTVKGLLADMARADEIEELQQELKVEREQRTNEERRLFYVAVTRARDYLYLCYEAGTQPSEFIRLIPEKLKAEHIMMTLEEERDYRRIAIGIDVSKGKSTVCGMKPGGEIVYTPFEVQHTREGMSELVSLLHNSGEEVRAVLESTGSYHCPVVAALLENGIFVSVINSLRMKRFCSQSIRKVKTDRIDAMQIALYGLAYWQELQPTRLPEDTYRELQLLARQYYQMTSILIKAKVDFNAICDQVLPGMQELMNDHAGRHKLSDFVLQYCHTTHILEMGETRFRKDYCKWAEKKGYRNCERMAMLIFATAQNGIPVLPNAPSTQIVITEAIRVLHTVEASRDAILTQMQALAKTLPEYSLVREMPCIGDTLAPRLIAEIGDVRRFHSKRALIAYAGIDAPPYQSGKFRANNRHISKRGNRYLRKTGYEVMQSYVMHKPANDPIFTFIEKKRGEGKSGKLAMVAGLNKFLRVYYGKVTELYRSLSAIE